MMVWGHCSAQETLVVYNYNIISMQCKRIPMLQNLVNIGKKNWFVHNVHKKTQMTFTVSKDFAKFHDDVIKWKHCPRNWPFVREIHRSPGEFPAKRPVTRSFDVFFDLRLSKRLSKQPWGWWFETPAWSLWRHRNFKGHFDWCNLVNKTLSEVISWRNYRIWNEFLINFDVLIKRLLWLFLITSNLDDN